MNPAHNGKSAAPVAKPQRECGLTGVTDPMTRLRPCLTEGNGPVLAPCYPRNRLTFRARLVGGHHGHGAHVDVAPAHAQAHRKWVS